MDVFLNLNNMNRRHCSLSLAALVLAALNTRAALAQSTTAHAAQPVRILVVGDSLSAEYGLKRGSGWVALLEQKLRTEKITASVVNASISGDTTSGGRARLSALLVQHRPTLVVIELGGNDALRGLPLTMTQDNLSAMAQAVQKAGARVLLLGMQVPPNYGRDYADRFAQLFVEVARANQAAVLPFFLKGIADAPDSLKWFQADRIHPLEAAHPLILANVWPVLKKELR